MGSATKRQIQLTLMAAGIQQFIDQLNLLSDSDLSELNGAEARDLIVEIGNNGIQSMSPLDYTVSKKDGI